MAPKNSKRAKAQNLAKARAAMVAKRAATEDASAKVGHESVMAVGLSTSAQDDAETLAMAVSTILEPPMTPSAHHARMPEDFLDELPPFSLDDDLTWAALPLP